MAPNDYVTARSQIVSNPLEACSVDERPYYPLLTIDKTSLLSVVTIGCAVLGYDVKDCIELGILKILDGNSKGDTEDTEEGGTEDEEDEEDTSLKVTVVTGGITNTLFRLSNLQSLQKVSPTIPKLSPNDHFSFETDTSILIRVFGAEGMINRDVENSTFASLSDAGIAPEYYGRFGNGRVEGWLQDFRALDPMEFHDPELSERIAHRMSELHGYPIPESLVEYYPANKPGLWTQLYDWMKQAKNPEINYRSNEDETRASSLFDLQFVEDELHHLQANIVPQESKVVFCHNDILAANVMMLPETGSVQLIDFEYGGVNFAAFDIANHFNEWAGGTDDGVPDYSMFPDEEERIGFITEYLRVLKAKNVDLNESDKAEEQPGDNEEKVRDEGILEEVHALGKEVDAFLLVNHLYWGLWAVNQGKTEGCEDFDYFLYASNRFAQYLNIKDDTASG